MTATDDYSLFDLTALCPDEESAIAYFEAQRWPGGVQCPECGSRDVFCSKTNRRLPLWVCREDECCNQFTVTCGTIMEDTKLPLRKWLLAFHIMGGSKKSVSSRYLARTLSVTVTTAWHLAHRVRATMADDTQKFSGIVETDETYIGGKRKHVGKGYRKNKIAVQTIVERNTGGVKGKKLRRGKAQTIALKPSENVDGRTVGAKLRTHTDPATTILMTDESAIYEKVGESFAEHHTVNHSKEEYVRGDPDGHTVTTNTAEGLL